MALKKLFAWQTVGGTDEGGGPTLEVGQHPLANRFVVAGQVQFGDGFAVARIRP